MFPDMVITSCVLVQQIQSSENRAPYVVCCVEEEKVCWGLDVIGLDYAWPKLLLVQTRGRLDHPDWRVEKDDEFTRSSPKIKMWLAL